jgi:ribosomal protein L12E/L44/L45/RPP1/RPP2
MAVDALPNGALVGDAPAADAVEPVLATAGVSVGNTSANLLQPTVEDTNAGQAGAPADTLLALATATDAPITTAAPASVAADVSNTTTSADTIAITGDVIALNDAPPPSANSLFSGSQYSDYGVTLTSDIVVPQQPTVSPVDTASAHDSLVPVVGDVQQPTPSSTDVDTTHSIDHLGLRDAIL